MPQHHDERDRPTPVVGHQLHRPDVQPIEHGRQVVGHLVLQIARARRRTPPRAAQVGAQYPVAVGGQRADQLVPLPPVFRKAVHQHYRRPVGGSGVGDVNRDATAHIDELVLDAIE